MGICQTNKTEHERRRRKPIALQDDVLWNVRYFLRGWSCLFSATGNTAHVIEADVEDNGGGVLSILIRRIPAQGPWLCIEF